MTTDLMPAEDTEEGEFTELDSDTRALVLAGDQQPAGTLAMALMPKEQFDARLVALTAGVQRVKEIQRALMRPAVDFMVIPGTGKNPSLLKPGAEKLADFYNLRAAFEHKRTVGDGVTAPPIHYLSRCDLHLGSLEGPITAQGYGSCSSWEKKYRWRGGGRECPNCHEQTIMRSKYAPKDQPNDPPGWYCNSRAGGCGKSFALAEVTGDEKPIENPDPHELDNTLLKMSKKRAFIDAVLRACNASGLFTQDVADDVPTSATTSDASGERSGVPSPQRRDPQTSPAPGGARQGDASAASSGATFEGIVHKPIDKVREVKPPDWYKGPEHATVARAELGFKISNRNHTAVLIGDLAFAAYEAGIETGDEVRTDGQLEEIEWAADKPKKKELWHVTRVEVMRDGEWHTVESLSGRVALPLDDLPDETANVPFVPPEPDYIAAANDAFGTDLVPAMSIDEMLKLPAASGEVNTTLDANLVLLEGQAAKAGARDVVVLDLSDKVNRYRAVMDADEAEIQKVGAYDAGEVVRLVGTWAANGAGVHFVVVTAITTP